MAGCRCETRIETASWASAGILKQRASPRDIRPSAVSHHGLTRHIKGATELQSQHCGCAIARRDASGATGFVIAEKDLHHAVIGLIATNSGGEP